MFPYSADLLIARFPLVAASPSRRRRMALPSEVVSSFIRTSPDIPYMLIACYSVSSGELHLPRYGGRLRELAASCCAAYYRQLDKSDRSTDMAPSDLRITPARCRSGAARPVAI